MDSSPVSASCSKLHWKQSELWQSWCQESAVKPLPISLPFPTWIKSMQVFSLQLPHHSQQAVYTLLPSAPWAASWAATGTESPQTLCTHHLMALPLFAFGSRGRSCPRIMHIHIPSFPRDDRNSSAVRNQRTQILIQESFLFCFFPSHHKNSSSVPALHLPSCQVLVPP